MLNLHRGRLQITFYCLEDWQRGAKLVARAAMMGHSKALHCLAIIHFNGSGGSRNDRYSNGPS